MNRRALIKRLGVWHLESPAPWLLGAAPDSGHGLSGLGWAYQAVNHPRPN